jgi:hypothetical protein
MNTFLGTVSLLAPLVSKDSFSKRISSQVINFLREFYCHEGVSEEVFDGEHILSQFMVCFL